MAALVTDTAADSDTMIRNLEAMGDYTLLRKLEATAARMSTRNAQHFSEDLEKEIQDSIHTIEDDLKTLDDYAAFDTSNAVSQAIKVAQYNAGLRGVSKRAFDKLAKDPELTTEVFGGTRERDDLAANAQTQQDIIRAEAYLRPTLDNMRLLSNNPVVSSDAAAAFLRF